MQLAPSESRRAKSDKVQVLDLDEDKGTDEDRILPDETDPCLETAIAYTSPDDNFFDPDLMQVVMLDVSMACRISSLISYDPC
jgi:hypothetical protein